MMRRFRSPLRLSVATLLVGGLLSPLAVAQGKTGVAKPAPQSNPAPSPSPEARRGIRPGDVQKVFALHHVRYEDMARILSVFPAQIGGAERGALRALSVSAAPAVVAAIEETIKRLDVPPEPAKSVDVTAYVLECLMQGPGAGTGGADLQDIVGQLKRTFGYSGCTLTQTFFARTSDQSNFTSSSSQKADETMVLHGNVVVDASQRPPLIHFNRLSYGVIGSRNTSFSAESLDVRDGQRVILGKAGSGGRDEILVLAVKVVE
jgi:hypothetical protein